MPLSTQAVSRRERLEQRWEPVAGLNQGANSALLLVARRLFARAGEIGWTMESMAPGGQSLGEQSLGGPVVVNSCQRAGLAELAGLVVDTGAAAAMAHSWALAVGAGHGVEPGNTGLYLAAVGSLVGLVAGNWAELVVGDLAELAADGLAALAGLVAGSLAGLVADDLVELAVDGLVALVADSLDELADIRIQAVVDADDD